jgi:hypothetical protein
VSPEINFVRCFANVLEQQADSMTVSALTRLSRRFGALQAILPHNL